MKTKILSIVTLLFAALSFYSCSSEKWEPNGGQDNKDKGEISLKSMGVEVSNAEQVISRLAVDLSEYIVTIYNAKNESVGEWKYAQMPEVVPLTVGDYKIVVKSHIVEKAAWEKPYFMGSKTFTIEANKLTEIGVIQCVLSNIKVSIKYDSSITPYLGDDVKVVVVANDQGSLIYTKGETRPGYFEAIEGSSTLVATLTGTICGYYETVVNTYTDAQAGQHRIITYKLKGTDPVTPDEVGTINPGEGINVDTDVVVEDINNSINNDEDVIPGDRPGQEDPENPTDPDPENPTDPEPGVDPITFTSTTIDFDNPNTPTEGVSYVVNIHAEATFAHLLVEIISNDLTDEMLRGVGLAAQFDLAYPGDLEEALKGSFGFPVGNEVIGQTDVVFDITNFVPLLNIYPGTHQFKITATDANNIQVVKTLTFVVQ